MELDEELLDVLSNQIKTLDDKIQAHIPVFDGSRRLDGAFPNSAFTYDHQANEYTCPGGKSLKENTDAKWPNHDRAPAKMGS